MNRNSDASFFFISSEDMTYEKQQDFFQENFSEVFRTYFIYSGFPFAQVYRTWDSYTPKYQNGKIVHEILINPKYDTLEKQQYFFQENFVEVFRFYYIYAGFPFATLLPYGSTVPGTIIVPEPESEPE